MEYLLPCILKPQQNHLEVCTIAYWLTASRTSTNVYNWHPVRCPVYAPSLSWPPAVVCRGTELAATCDKQLAAFLTQQQQQPAPDNTQQEQQQQKPFSSFLATTLMLMSELAKVSGWALQAQVLIAVDLSRAGWDVMLRSRRIDSVGYAVCSTLL
jgi:hypothetical protein